LDEGRHDLAQILQNGIEGWYKDYERKSHEVSPVCSWNTTSSNILLLRTQQIIFPSQILSKGNIRLIKDDFSHPAHLSTIVNSDVLFVNNAERLFAEPQLNEPSLDDQLCAMFALAKPGTRMVTFYELFRLKSSENDCMERHAQKKVRDANFEKSAKKNASTMIDPPFFSFFRKEIINLGLDAATWGQMKEMECFYYTRVSTPCDDIDPTGNTACFTCETCYHVSKAVDKATVTVEDRCSNVKCKAKRRKSRRAVNGRESK
jgi:hypothetical protein